MLYPQNGDRVVAVDFVTSLHPVCTPFTLPHLAFLLFSGQIPRRICRRTQPDSLSLHGRRTTSPLLFTQTLTVRCVLLLIAAFKFRVL